MALLLHPKSERHEERSVQLRARTLIGRSPAVDLRLDDPNVSREHAVIAWGPGGWELRDLGSSNGTLVDGERIEPGVSHRLTQGCTIAFGTHGPRWVLQTDRPPSLVAMCGQDVVEGDGELLLLPHADDPQVMVHHEPPHGWVMERDGACTAVKDRATFALDGKVWQLLLPQSSTPTGQWEDDHTIDRLHLDFAVSADEEYVEVVVRMGAESHALPSRAHHYTLLTLARARLADAAEGGHANEHGWVYASDLQTMLRASSNQLYVSVHRARREFEDLGVAGAASLVQRRTTTRQLRLGVASLSVRPL